MPEDHALPSIEVATGTYPSAAVIWLHGLGADGYDFEPIVSQLQIPVDMGVRFVFPHAPIQPVSLNGGMPMRAWYDIYRLDSDSPEDEGGLRSSAAGLTQLIERESDRGIPNDRIILAGFSQGGAVALFTGLRHPSPLAGILGLSTYLPLRATLAKECTPANARTRIFLGHGKRDDVVSCTHAMQGRDELSRLGYCVDWYDYPMMGHSVCQEEILDIRGWLIERLR